MSRWSRILAVVAALCMLATACGDDDASSDGGAAQDDVGDAIDQDEMDDADQSVEPPGEAADEDPPEEEAGEAPPDAPGSAGAPESPVVAPMQQSYGEDPDAAMGFDVFVVTAYWFVGPDGFRVVQFHPIDPSSFTDVCPGASAATGGSFDHVANAETGGEACAGFPTLVGGDVRAYDCDGILTLRTAIPADAPADFLYASLETAAGGGDVQGYTSIAAPGGEPSFDVSSCAPLV